MHNIKSNGNVAGSFNAKLIYVSILKLSQTRGLLQSNVRFKTNLVKKCKSKVTNSYRFMHFSNSYRFQIHTVLTNSYRFMHISVLLVNFHFSIQHYRVYMNCTRNDKIYCLTYYSSLDSCLTYVLFVCNFILEKAYFLTFHVKRMFTKH